MPRRPNVLFFFTDDQRFDTIRALGNDEIHTPNLDALAARGAVFTRAHIPGGTSGAVCMPSRAMLHTGRTLFHIEHEGQEIPAAHTTLGETFRRAGFETLGVGKWHNGRNAFARGFTGGDEIFFMGMGDHWNVPLYRFDPSGRYDARLPWIEDPNLTHTLAFRDGDHMCAGAHSTDLFVDASIRLLENRDRSRPFFLYTSLMAPHDPRSMPERFLRMYDPGSIRLPENFLPEHPIDTGALRIRDELLAEFPRDPAAIRRHIAEYYAMISHLDEGLGRLLDALRRLGDAEDTILVFAGDNGLAVGQHGLMGKQNVYEHSVRVPLMLAGPGIPEGVRSDTLACLFDLFPTLCDLTGLETPDSVEGHSLSPCLTDPGAAVREDLYLAYGGSIRGVTNGRHKLIEYACGETQFFDLVQDPLERKDLSGNDEERGRVAALRRRLRALAVEWDDERHPHGHTFWAARTDLLKPET